jgi:hypothetical protein
MDMKALLKSRMDFYRRNPGERARLMARAESRKLEKYGRIQTEGVKRNIKQTKRWNKIKADTTKKKRESENRRRAAVLKRRSEKSKLERQASEVAFKRVAAERKKRAEARLTPQQRLLRSKSQTSLARRRAAEKKLKSEEARDRAKWKARANDPTTSN